MGHRRTLLPLAAALTLFMTGCDADDTTDDPADDTAEPADGAAAQVDIVDNGFDPGDVEVAAGETVEWVHTGNAGHTVTFEDGEDSGSLSGGDTYSRTFDETGEYPYACAIHPTMQGTVTTTD